eukprot:jgi/Botrbrau1/22502/Bobra.114_2s0028.1
MPQILIQLPHLCVGSLKWLSHSHAPSLACRVPSAFRVVQPKVVRSVECTSKQAVASLLVKLWGTGTDTIEWEIQRRTSPGIQPAST